MGKGTPSQKKQYVWNLILAAVVSQVGCLTTVVVVLALLMGLWIDTRLGTRPWVTIVLLVLSVPVTLALMFWVVRRLTSRIRPTPSIFSTKEAKGDGPQEP